MKWLFHRTYVDEHDRLVQEIKMDESEMYVRDRVLRALSDGKTVTFQVVIDDGEME